MGRVKEAANDLWDDAKLDITEKKPDAGAKRQETQKGECVPNLRVLTKPNIKPPLLTTGAWGPFLESPGNFTGPKSNIQIEM